MVFAQFSIADISKQWLDFQRFMDVWMSVTDLNEIVKRRRDHDHYFEIEQNGELLVETFFTHEEASLLVKRFPGQFSILINA